MGRASGPFIWRSLEFGKLTLTSIVDAGWSSPVARQAHNLKVTGSNPVPATRYQKRPASRGPFCYAAVRAARFELSSGAAGEAEAAGQKCRILSPQPCDTDTPVAKAPGSFVCSRRQLPIDVESQGSPGLVPCAGCHHAGAIAAEATFQQAESVMHDLLRRKRCATESARAANN